MSGKSSRDKGHAFERKVVNQLKPFFPEARRNLTQTRDGGEDVLGTPFTIEAKFGKATRIKKAYYQAKRAGKNPVAITKDKNKDQLVTMSMDTFLALLSWVSDIQEKE